MPAPFLAKKSPMKNTLSILSVLLLFFACAKEKGQVPESNMQEEKSEFIQGELSVKLDEELAARIEKGGILESSLQISSIERVFPDAGKFEERTRKAGLHRWYRIKYDAPVVATKAAVELLDIPGVEISEEVRKIKNTALFNDPYLPMMWHLGDGKTPTVSINVEPVWANYTVGSSSVIVGIIDGGVQTDHEDLAGVVIPGGAEGSKSFVDNGFNITAHTHGTHVGGTIAAISGNGLGVSGIAGGNAAAGIQGVKLLSCQIFKTVDGKDRGGDTAAAIKWAADHGACIINNSWGYDYDSDGNGTLTGDELTRALAANIQFEDKDAVDYFIKYAGYDENGNQTGPMAGGVVFFAAGNDGIKNGAPANYEPVIAVGATDANGVRASFSNYGTWVDIAAPGTEILSTYPDNSYARLQGTSMACPNVTGVAALLLSYYGGRGFTNDQLIDKLIGGANQDILPAGSQIGPLVDAMGAFAYSSPEPPAKVTGITSSASANRLDLSFEVTGNSDGTPAYSFLMAASKDRALVENFDPFSAVPEGVTVSTTLANGKKVGDPITVSINNLEFEQDYHAVVLAANYLKKFSAPSDVISQKTYANNPPAITALEPAPYSIKASEVRTLAFSLSDPDGHAITISFDGGSAAADYNYDQSTGTLSVILRGKRADAGTYRAAIKATDSYGAVAEHEFTYTIRENEPPVLVSGFNDIMVYEKNTPINVDLAGHFSDPEEEAISFKVRGNNPSLVKIDFSGGTMKVTPLAYGLSDLTIVAVDAANKECTAPLKILVKDTENPAESYPNPVIDVLTIRTEEEAATHIVLTNSNGVAVFDKTLTVSGFNPAKIDMSKCAPGQYKLRIEYSGNKYERIVIKK